MDSRGPALTGRRNRLSSEKSPYLLQHAANPVDWYPWGEAAFARARAEDRPIFLSIGYSTCHWCHVMARESFEDEEVAALMNQAFVNVKVDREERPDIDHVYMTVCQMLSESCGWPLNVLLTPDGQPFFAATYIPKENRFGRLGMLELVPRIRQLWLSEREQLASSAAQVTARLQSFSAVPDGGELDAAVLVTAERQLTERYDGLHGGFGQAPKFPMPHNLLFLLRRWRRSGEPAVLAMVEHTLTAMRHGGIYDQIGFGFHRYSTDREWRLPHFEKMLYDQALLAMAYLEAFQATGNGLFADTAGEIFTYVERHLTAPEGGFYSAEDADSEGEEGKFCVWSDAELREVLGDEDGALAARAYGVRPAGNFAVEATGRHDGANVLHLTRGLPRLASELGLTEVDLWQRLGTIGERLLARRDERERPLRDDKVLTDWNGLMIAALAKGARVLDRPDYAAKARRAADFILTSLRTDDGRLWHRYRLGEPAVPGAVDDYAFVIWGMIELYETTFDVAYLATALELNQRLVDHFWDEAAGGLFFTADDAESLIVRGKELYDGAVPSGNSVAMSNLLRLARLTGDVTLEERAAEIGRAAAGVVNSTPLGFTQLLVGLDFAVGPSYEVVVIGDPSADDTRAMLRALGGAYVPNMVVLLRPVEGRGLVERMPGKRRSEDRALGKRVQDERAPEGPGSDEQAPAIDRVAGFVRGYDSIGGRATAYVCQGFVCRRPTTDVAEMLEALGVDRES